MQARGSSGQPQSRPNAIMFAAQQLSRSTSQKSSPRPYTFQVFFRRLPTKRPPLLHLLDRAVHVPAHLRGPRSAVRRRGNPRHLRGHHAHLHPAATPLLLRLFDDEGRAFQAKSLEYFCYLLSTGPLM